LARRHRVGAGQREAGLGVIEVRGLPGRGRVARLASLGEVARHVIRVGCALEVVQMTANACGHRQVVVFICVTLVAGGRRYGVPSGQWEAGQQMVEFRRHPGDRRVAGLACGDENFRFLRMVRIGSGVVVVLVTSNACRCREIVVVVLVAVGTCGGRHRVASAQDEAGCGMIKLGIRPVVGGMAVLARRGRENRNHIVLWIRCAVEVLAVATEALRGHIVELGKSATLMAILAGRSGVRTGQRKPVHVQVDLGDRNLPAADRVTVFAGSGHFAAVNVRMAVGAFIADIGEHHLAMAVRAGHTLVHAAERKLGLVVIELWHRADWFPSVHGVAVLTGDIQIAVGAAGLLGRLRRGSASHGRRQQKPQDHPFCDQT
jgi:hypothetical protein